MKITSVGHERMTTKRKTSVIIEMRSANCKTKITEEPFKMSLNDIHSLSHTSWNCKYHIVFAPKYRRKVFYKNHRATVGKILRQLCEWKGVNIIEAEVCPEHIHMLVEIPPKMAVSSFKGCLKGKSIIEMLLEQNVDIFRFLQQKASKSLYNYRYIIKKQRIYLYGIARINTRAIF